VPLSPLDAAYLRIEDRTSLVINAGAMVFAEPLDFEIGYRRSRPSRKGSICRTPS
jgi:hypothetical protein